MAQKAKIIYTNTDEAPALATASLLPIVEAYVKKANIELECRDISLAGRILSQFPERLKPQQRIADELSNMGQMVKNPEANIIKLPNISASIPQIKAAIAELQGKGYDIPDYPEDPKTDEELAFQKSYDKVKGSAVNPVLREGNSDRRAPKAVKNYARKNPHTMGKWSKKSLTRVVSMEHGDFYESEKSIVLDRNNSFTIRFTDTEGNSRDLKKTSPLLKGELIDAAVMSRESLRSFIKSAIDEAKNKNILFSAHLKATMMKVSDPIIFGQILTVFFEDLFQKNSKLFDEMGFNPRLGLGDFYTRMEALPAEKRDSLNKEIAAIYSARPDLAMVDSDRGITNLHVSSDIIIDASMPAAIRNGGQMWGPDGKSRDMIAFIPDRSYAGIYEATIEFCKVHGSFDPVTMGSVSNVGLMAQKAEEYGSHDKTFEIESKGIVEIIDDGGTVLLSQKVEEGDLFRMCQAKDAPIRDWVKLAVKRSKATGDPTIFWLDPKRGHDSQLIEKVKTYLGEMDTDGLDLRILSPTQACQFSLERIKEGKDTVSVTGNVLRDYLTDLFPIMEVGTSAKMLSIVPLMNGGGLFETGAGGSAPKHVQQFEKEGHLRWDSLGEFLALAVSMEHLGNSYNNPKALILSETLDKATELVLENGQSPSRKVNEIDNRGSHFYLALYWAEALASQNKDKELKQQFTTFASELRRAEKKIASELLETQGKPMDIGGYYLPDEKLKNKAMRPSNTFNELLATL